MARVLVISSHVTHGNVGLTASVPALQGLGHEVWPLPTVLLASRPGLGQMARHAVPPSDLASMLAALEADGSWPHLDAVLTGYFPSPESVVAAADAIARIKRANPGITVMVDPILGDAGALYVPEATARAIREHLLPLATIATPNLFELHWLAQCSVDDRAAIEAAVARLDIASIVVTSAEESADAIATLLIASGRITAFQSPRHPDIPNGTGDVFAGLLLGYLLHGQDQDSALVSALDDLDGVLTESEGRPVLQLSTLVKGAG
jgi:pyridoxine kinase